jgi:hypothetical protein
MAYTKDSEMFQVCQNLGRRPTSRSTEVESICALYSALPSAQFQFSLSSTAENSPNYFLVLNSSSSDKTCKSELGLTSSPSIGRISPLQAPNRVNFKECDEGIPDESAV